MSKFEGDDVNSTSIQKEIHPQIAGINWLKIFNWFHGSW